MNRGQLLLDLEVAQAQSREDFMPGPTNAAALNAIDNSATWPDRRLMIIGPHGSGRSHLLRIWAQQSGAVYQSGRALDPDALSSAALAPAVVIDDADAIAGNADAEEVAFHIMNGCANTQRSLLLSALDTPTTWGVELPDLLSRLQACLQVKIEQPDDGLLHMVLVKLCDDRQLAVSAEILQYLQRRIDRSLDTAHRVVAALDKAALQDQRRITRSLAAQVLADLDLSGS